MSTETVNIEGIAQELKLLANPNRLRILARLLEGEMSVGDIEVELGIRQPSLSRELSNLREAGTISARRESKVVFYAINPGGIEPLLRRVLALDAAARPTRASTQPDFDPRPKFRFYARPGQALRPQDQIHGVTS